MTTEAKDVSEPQDQGVGDQPLVTDRASRFVLDNQGTLVELLKEATRHVLRCECDVEVNSGEEPCEVVLDVRECGLTIELDDSGENPQWMLLAWTSYPDSREEPGGVHDSVVMKSSENIAIAAKVADCIFQDELEAWSMGYLTYQ